MKCVVYEFGFRAAEARADDPYGNDRYTSLGTAQYAYHYDEVMLSPEARAKLLEAHRLVAWYQYLGCRLEPGVELPDVGQNQVH